MSPDARSPDGRRRLALAAAALVVVAVGLAVSRGTGLVADLAGGALYAALVVVLVALVRPRAPSWAVGAAALAICVAVELLQLTDLPRDVVAQMPVLRYVLGTTFVATDLAAYAAGALAAAGADGALRRHLGERSLSAPGRRPR
ncbi:DUF2809 domain-containing protein [Actinotalea solisilvae]|uniref:DUF2809 domain-containing protein n=1 Tax=Actinotalea solisilvae TaxID=2072922 RepID=UPI001F2526D2|nr:DUF2809 domain-containing protein [Actinotalea solisilvae]